MKLFFLLLLALCACSTYGQNGVLWNKYFISGSLSVGKNAPGVYADSSAWLEIGKDTTTKGLVFPKVITDSFRTGKRGNFVYGLADSVLYHFDGTAKTRYMTYKDTAMLRTVFGINGLNSGLDSKENTANKSTSGFLGLSDILFPTQRAVKTYVDTTLKGYVSLSGTYNNPAWLTALGWNKITGTPTTVAGYGITNAIAQSGNSFGSTASIGTLDNNHLELFTNGLANTRYRITNAGNHLWNSTTNSGQTFQFNGTHIINAGTGSLSVGATGATVITAGSGEQVLQVGNDQPYQIRMGVGRGGQFSMGEPFIQFSSGVGGTNGPYIKAAGMPAGYGNYSIAMGPINTLSMFNNNSSPTEMRGAPIGNWAGTMLRIGDWYNDHGARTSTSGNLYTLEIMYVVNAKWAPASGNANWVGLLAQPVSALPVGSTAAGHLGMIHWNPQVEPGTVTPNYRMIQSSAPSGYDLFLTGGAKSRITGNVGIGADADTSNKLLVTGSFRTTSTIQTAQPSANGAGVTKMGKVLIGSDGGKYWEVEIDGLLYYIAVLRELP